MTIIIKILTTKSNGRIFKAVREKVQVAYEDINIRITLGVLVETLKARRTWTDVLYTLKRTYMRVQTTILHKTFSHHNEEKRYSMIKF